MLHKAERNVRFAQQQPLERSKLFRNSCHVGGCRINERIPSTPWMSSPVLRSSLEDSIVGPIIWISLTQRLIIFDRLATNFSSPQPF